MGRVWNAGSILGYWLPLHHLLRRAAVVRRSLEAFESRLRAVLAELADDDTFVEENEFLSRLGRRSAP